MIALIHYDTDYVPNPPKNPKTFHRQFYLARNLVVETCARYGTVGQLGYAVITPDMSPKDIEEQNFKWEFGNETPEFFVLDDILSVDQYVYIELYNPKKLTAAFIHDLCRGLAGTDGWGVGVINIINGCMLIFYDRIMVTGKPFQKCRNLEMAVEIAARNLHLLTDRA